MIRSLGLAWSLLSLCFICSGATCARRRTISEFTPPVVFSQTPTLEQLIEHANRSLDIERIESNTLTITSPDIMAKLSGNLQWERPHNFNLQAYMGSRVLGTALAAGSNAEMFWLQTQTPPPATLYYARYNEFEMQPGPRRILPVSPLWLREALGIIEFDRSLEHEGPLVRTDGKLEVRSLIPSPRGAYRRVVVFAPTTGAIEETMLYDQSNRLVARAQQSEHEYYSAIKSSLPHRIIVQLLPDSGPMDSGQPTALSFTIDVGLYMINQPGNAQVSAFTLPDATGLSTVDLVQANAQLGQAVAPVPPVYRSSNADVYGGGLEGFRR